MREALRRVCLVLDSGNAVIRYFDQILVAFRALVVAVSTISRLGFLLLIRPLAIGFNRDLVRAFWNAVQNLLKVPTLH
jgi:hypothetical protein